MHEASDKQCMVNRIREYRKRAGLTMDELSARIGMTQGNLSKLERGEIGYTQYSLESLARELGCRPIDLIADAGLGTVDEKLLGIVLAGVFERVRDLRLQLEPEALATICAHVYQEAAETDPAARRSTALERADTVLRYEARRAG